MDTLILDLRGPLRSWGTHSLGDDRWTEMRPTASAIVGMVGACAGIDRNNAPLMELWHGSWDVMTASATSWSNSNCPRSLRPAIRPDFQTARGSLQMDGLANPDAVIGYRAYLENSREVAAISLKPGAPAGLLKRALSGLANPVYQPSLGRKACPPSAPLLAENGHLKSKAGDFASVADRLIEQLGRPGLMEDEISVHALELSCNAGALSAWAQDWRKNTGVSPAVTRQDACDLQNGHFRSHRNRSVDVIRVRVPVAAGAHDTSADGFRFNVKE